LSRPAFVDRLLKSNEVNSSKEIFPRKGEFGQLSSSNQDNTVHVISEIAIKVAQLLLPQDADAGASALLCRMTENPRFRKFALPDLDDSQESYAKWTANPVVSAIKSALTTLGRRDQGLREQLLSLVSGYPKSWLQNHLGVGRVLVNNAIDLASSVGPGMHPAVVKNWSEIGEPERRRSFFLSGW
jgi:hypothetical protein